MYALLSMCFRRVHISKSTLNVLKDLNVIGTKYVVEDGFGMERSDYLAERNITTYFITRKENVSISFMYLWLLACI